MSGANRDQESVWVARGVPRSVLVTVAWRVLDPRHLASALLAAAQATDPDMRVRHSPCDHRRRGGVVGRLP